MIDDFGIQLSSDFEGRISENEFSEDHWRVLRIIGKDIAQKGHFSINPNKQMRTARHHYKISASNQYMKSGEGTKLKSGDLLLVHDDWDIIMDFAEAGYFTVRDGKKSIKPKRRVKFSEKGKLAYHKIK